MNNTNSLVYTPTSSTLCEFKVPSATVFNLAKSFVGIQMPYPAGAAGNWTTVYDKGVTAFRSVFFGPGGGLPLLDMPFSDVYTECMLPMRTKRSELDANPMNALYRCNQLNTSNLLPASRDGLLTGTQNASSSAYTENQYLRFSPAPATALTVNKLYPLSSFVDTILDQDQDVVFGTDMYLRFQTAPLQRMVFYTTSPANPNVAANLTSINANVTAANVFLYLAIEENITIKNSLISSLASGGLKMAIPNVVVNRVSLPANQVSNNVTLSLNKSAGSILKRIVNAFYNGTEFSGSYAFDHGNVNGTRVSSFQSAINSRPLQDYIQIPFNPDSTVLPTGVVSPSILADDWRENHKYITGSAVGSYSEYQSNWVWTDAWGVPAFSDETDHRISKNLDGYNLLDQGDVIYTLALQSSAAADVNYANRDGLILYQFCNLIRHLHIMPSGVSISV
jgi:hypothetical protein